jgi:hypothetical protein
MNNKELKTMIPSIIENKLKFYKGNISGNSIEIEEHEPDSFTSFIYYESDIRRDEDFLELEKLTKL